MSNFIVELQQDLLKVSGPDSEKFLQGQLSCDVSRLQPGHSSLGTVCNTKGRVVSAFRILKFNDDFYLSLPSGMGEITRAHLGKFIVFFKAEITDARDEYQCFGLAGASAGSVLERHFSGLPASSGLYLAEQAQILIALHHPEGTAPRYEYRIAVDATGGDNAASVLDELKQSLPAGTHNDWRLSELQNGYYLPASGQSELYTPEELNLDLTDAVSFSKGCYTGQEIVARMHYRGQGKKRLYFFESTEPFTIPLATPFTTTPSAALPAELKALTLSSDEGTGSTELLSVLADNQGYLHGLVILKSDRLPAQPVVASPESVQVPVTLHSQHLPLHRPESGV